ncbi:MAG: putative Response regulator, CheY like (Modular protein) [Candidatus Nitrospira kreftii]|uniref:Putative Response regulator, CheY like (Modular protein) n=1 Tax=Candidatus Nitrospira kreftii TaxID=2652173 RepID=A0A7S8IZP1_9BACT|nr:MAG: putative Response regulator, CheY like (Modular protein) [Candidatus Nitrospira kreftii]
MPSPIFVVDSSPAVRRMVEQISIPEGFEVVGFQDGPAALEAARRSTPSLIIADYHLDNMTFSGFCKEINKLDNLTETALISLINSADHPDEHHLRTLGVKAFLKKPFQSDDLLEVLKSLEKTPAGSSNGKGLKRRVWPPTSTSTDTESDEWSDSIASNEGQEEVQSHSRPAAIIPPVSSAGPEDAMKGLFDQLLQSMTKRSEQRLADLLPQVIEAKLGTHVRPIIEKELQQQLGRILSQEYLTLLIQPLLAQTVPSLIKQELTSCEPIIRQAVADLAKPSIGENVDRLVREQVESGVHQYLPAVVREQVGTIDQIVKDELHQAVSKQAPLMAHDLVRTTAKDSVEQAVLRIVPDVAEQHIKAEIKRLIETDEASRSAKG